MGRLFDGTCRMCGEDYKGQGISSHVKRCLADHANEAAIHHGLLVGLRADGLDGRYWRYVLVRPEASLEALDAYLRDHWMECCEHPSVFEVDGTRYLSTLGPDEEPPTRPTSEPADDEDDDEEPPAIESMATDIGAVLRPRMDFGYLYDPTCPTEVEGTVYDPYPCPATLVEDPDDADVVTVAHNTISDLSCGHCDKDAEFFCPACLEAQREAEKAAEKAAEEADEDVEITVDSDLPPPYTCATHRARYTTEKLAPVANSPRMGVCEYEG